MTRSALSLAVPFGVLLSVALLSLALLTVAPSRAAASDSTCEEIRPGLIRCTVTEVDGRRQAPGSFYVLTRTRDAYEPTPLVRHDGPRDIRRTVRHAPF